MIFSEYTPGQGISVYKDIGILVGRLTHASTSGGSKCGPWVLRIRDYPTLLFSFEELLAISNRLKELNNDTPQS